MRRFGPLVLNDGAPATSTAAAGPPLAEDLVRLLLGNHRDAASDVARRLVLVDPARLDTGAERLAFWINVYNALVLHGIAALGVRRSVWETWNFYGRVRYRVGDVTLSLDDIEHGILRGNRPRVWPPWPSFHRRDGRRRLAVRPLDPRLHFAINCGAGACPPIAIYRAAVLDAQLDLAARSFVNQEVRLASDGRVACSKLFKWYRADFEQGQSLVAFLRRYLDDGDVRRALAADAPPRLTFRPYSWALKPPLAT